MQSSQSSLFSNNIKRWPKKDKKQFQGGSNVVLMVGMSIIQKLHCILVHLVWTSIYVRNKNKNRRQLSVRILKIYFQYHKINVIESITDCQQNIIFSLVKTFIPLNEE